jgi:tRNA threonylcarbamoyladenosine biosynthesis protein TsaE
MATFISHNPQETEAFGARLALRAVPGLVIGLCGDLGAGKTSLVRGLARGLGIPSRVHSPTFTLVNEYTGGRLKLFHLDLYRLETPDQLQSAGIEEFLSPDGVAVIEWAERLELGGWKLEPGKNFVRVDIALISETERRITCDGP